MTLTRASLGELVAGSLADSSETRTQIPLAIQKRIDQYGIVGKELPEPPLKE